MKTDIQLKETAYRLLEERGVTIQDIAELVLYLQNRYIPDLTMEEAIESLHSVMNKREVQNTIVTGVELDILAEKGLLTEPLASILVSDEGLYGIDEVLGLSIVNLYGSIGFTNYGYLDKVKPGVISRLDSKGGNQCHTFLDDIVCALAAAAASRIAHNDPAKSAITNQN